ncbi:MAG: hypothetical protein HS113_01055 [Verrucomicrobiales bacterium]|nr:hypothetical protein [Verrucomicrobiales bacterium]
MRRSILLVLVSVCGLPALAGALGHPEIATDRPPRPEPAPVAFAPPADEAWSFGVSAFAYFVPDDRDYLQPTITADRGGLHFEARYNYEDQETGSVWFGGNVSGGEALAWELTPMIGGVFGATTGIAPGVKASLSWWRLQLYVEGEYVMDAGDSEGTFLYAWTELTLAPLDWFRLGVVSQRTRAYASDLDIQRGFLVGFSYKQVDLSAYVFNPDASGPPIVLALAVVF